MRNFVRNNGLSLALLALFLLSICGQVLFGWRAFLEEQQEHGLADVTLAGYLATGHFLSATFENWESEFLQMVGYVLLTALLFQKGSPESRDPEGPNPQDDVPPARTAPPDAPWPVHRGGLLRRLYSHSLSLALILLLLFSFGMHVLGSTRKLSEEAMRHGQPPTTIVQTLGEPEFWYESFQNWQSEFLSIGVLLVLAIFLRERGSPESKPVAAPHGKTGH
jgi:hypothetical protein